jgi:hypothetical protein
MLHNIKNRLRIIARSYIAEMKEHASWAWAVTFAVLLGVGWLICAGS